MEKNRELVRRETLYILMVSLMLTALAQAVYAALGRWTTDALWGGLIGLAAAVGNFYLMGRMVAQAAGMDAEAARKKVRASQGLRNLMLLGIAAVGALVPGIDPVPLLIALFFPRLAVALRPLWDRMRGQAADGGR